MNAPRQDQLNSNNHHIFGSAHSGGFNMEAMSAQMTGGRKIKQRSKRKRVIKRRGKIKKQR